MKKIILYLFISGISFLSFAQNHTVGLLKAVNSKTYPGYNLIYPHEQPNVYLLDNCGAIVHTWTDVSDSRPGNTVYLQEDGSIIKTKRPAAITGNPMWSGGGGGTVEKRDWNNNLLWTFTLNDSFNRLHHDIEPMPNGNILMICWVKKTKAQAIAQGRNPSFLANGEVWYDKIIEVKPIGKDSFDIVWEWHLWDHLIQDFDSTKPNYGKPENFPGKVNFNYANLNSAKNWAFLNAISYNLGLDQIVVSSPSFNEVWVIDHSTTKAQAATSLGGFGKSGGDLIFRWGNPHAYNSGTVQDQKLFFQHDIHWMGKNFGERDFGKLMVFNNRAGANYSTVNIIETNFDNYFWKYNKTGNTYLPKNFSWTYRRPDSTAMFSSGLSGVQRLDNGNTLICSAQQGYTFEITPSNEIVWEYVTPLKLGVKVKQGDSLKTADNNTFRVKRYGMDFPAFVGKNLTPKGYIELNPDTNFCSLVANIQKVNIEKSLSIYPNPANNLLHIKADNVKFNINSIRIQSITGKTILEQNNLSEREKDLDVSKLPDGLYFLSINGQGIPQKIVVKH
jgi:hypothetical protein